ncbi:hypothetical protein SCLCIDRAFT_1220339 [Scleroderma citrinum Foug A]|uniref:Uncharacterized protein n=1 Tax=Scleroderma citrinum Foug A TaxID=1036808 RepID=A0A0C2ZVL6_9AGAM|nr:hypothetical protein SCLCIDRAFT_1220339 [Scleroderma citrinum Foug A]
MPWPGLDTCRLAPELAQSMKKTSCVMWKSSGTYGVKLEAFWDCGFGNISGEWTRFDVDGTDDPNRDWRGLMIPHYPSKQRNFELLVDGASTKFSCAPNGIKLGDYGHFMDSENFCCEGNLLADLKSVSLKADITPREHIISEWNGHQGEGGVVSTHDDPVGFIEFCKPLGLSLPSNDDFKSLLVSFSTRLTNRYLITRVIQCPPDPRRSGSGTLYNIAKPFVWHRNAGVGLVVGGAVR